VRLDAGAVGVPAPSELGCQEHVPQHTPASGGGSCYPLVRDGGAGVTVALWA
jgi:hypothetical protein